MLLCALLGGRTPNPTPAVSAPPYAEREGSPIERAQWRTSRWLTGDRPDFDLAEASSLHAHAAEHFSAQRLARPTLPSAPSNQWQPIGPQPIWQVSRSSGQTVAMSGRVSALAIRSTPPYSIYLGGAQGGVWVTTPPQNGVAQPWHARTDSLASLAIGALALAPSNEDVVYVGTGEGNLSGDSYFGNGALKSTDGGATFAKVSGDTFRNVSIAQLAVDPLNADHLYAAVLRGRGGARRTTPPEQTVWGIWESTTGGATWLPRLTTTPLTLSFMSGATNIYIDPFEPQTLYAAFIGQGFSKTVDGGVTWFSIMTGLPIVDYAALPTRFALGMARPSAAVSATLYAGFEWPGSAATVWKSTNAGETWAATNSTTVAGYCGGQCWYDNVIGVNPNNPDIVYALGMYDYGRNSGGIYRSTDGGANWIDVGYNLHPDYHAIAFRTDDAQQVVIGNDGGVWYSPTGGGRLNGNSDPASAVDWVNLNYSAANGESGLQIAQFTSIAQHPTRAEVTFGGTQDNGTLRKTAGDFTWADQTFGDGGQVLVDPILPQYVYGTYYGISPYRSRNGLEIYSNHQSIGIGLNTGDRSEFYIPWTFDPAHPERLYLGTYRVYRSDNGRAPTVTWRVISPDLTSGCAGTAANGARGCVISTISAAWGADVVYVGTLEGHLYLGQNASTSPSWARVDLNGPLPHRPITAIAIDPSDYRVAYVAVAGFNAATPTTPGHLFRTTDAGHTWQAADAGLPDIPINTVVLDPGKPNTVYIGTDVGVYVSEDGGGTWTPLGEGLPIVAVWQLSFNAFTRQLVAGTHGRGAWAWQDAQPQPTLAMRAEVTSQPLVPGEVFTVTLTLANHGQAPLRGITLTSPLPVSTTFVAADLGGQRITDVARWNDLYVPPAKINSAGGVRPGQLTAHLTLRLDAAFDPAQPLTLTDITANANVLRTTASPLPLALTPNPGLLVFPTSQFDGARAGETLSYTLKVYAPATISVTAAISATYPTTLWNADFSAPLASTFIVTEHSAIGVQVALPHTPTVFADVAAIIFTTSPTQTYTTTINSVVVTRPVLLVDGDDNLPDVRANYEQALTGREYDVWDLATNPILPRRYLLAHDAVAWFTGARYPEPIRPYEPDLRAFLQAGGIVFLSGWDVQDGMSGASDFMREYAHLTPASSWAEAEALTDQAGITLTAVLTNPITGGLGELPLNSSSLSSVNYSDRLTVRAPALTALVDASGAPVALTVQTTDAQTQRRSQLTFFAVPLEALGTPADRTTILTRSLRFYETSVKQLYLPLIQR